MRRAQPGDAAAFLVHEQARPLRQRLTQSADQAGELRRVLDVAREQDRARGRLGTEQRGLFVAERWAGHADDRGLHWLRPSLG